MALLERYSKNTLKRTLQTIERVAEKKQKTEKTTYQSGAGTSAPNVVAPGNTGVTTLATEGEIGLVGDVTLSEGTGITLTQVGQDIEIACDLAHSELSDIVTDADAVDDHDGRYPTKALLASTATGEGASLIGIEDAADYFAALDVEGALAELGAIPILWQRTGTVLTPANAGDTVELEQTSTTGNAFKVSRNLSAASTSAPVASIIQDNADDAQNALEVRNDGTGFAISASSTKADQEAIKGANVAAGGQGVTGLGEHIGIVGTQTGGENDDYGVTGNRVSAGDYIDIDEVASDPANAQADMWRLYAKSGGLYYLDDTGAITGPLGAAGAASPLTTKGDIYTYTTVDAALPVGTNGYALVADVSTATGLNYKPRAPLHEQTWQLMAENVSTDNMLVSHKRGALYSAGDGSTAPSHTSTWDTTNHKSTANYSEIAVSTNVTYIAPGIFNFTTAGYVAFFMNVPIVTNATSAVVTVRLRRVGSNNTDAQTVIKVSLSDDDGSHPFAGTKLVSALGTTWEDLTTGGCDLTAGPSITSQTWQISMYSLAAPTASANSKTTVQIDSVKVEQY